MDIHKPKPWRGWREFLKEIGTIVVGVLIALGAEQSVEAVHHHREVGDLRRALDQELAWNLAAIKDIADAYPCTRERVAELHTWSRALETGTPLKLTHAIADPGFLIFRNAAWRSATSGTLDHMPTETRVAYANFYAGVENNQAHRKALLDGWRDLAPFEEAADLTREERVRIDHDLNDIRQSAATLAENYKTWRDIYAPALGIGLDDAARQQPNVALRIATQAEMCRPVLAPTP